MPIGKKPLAIKAASTSPSWIKRKGVQQKAPTTVMGRVSRTFPANSPEGRNVKGKATREDLRRITKSKRP